MRFVTSALFLATFALAAPAGADEFAAGHVLIGTEAESGRPRLVEFDRDGTYVRTLDLGTEEDSGTIYGLVFGPDGHAYAGNVNSGQIFRVAPDGTSTVFFDDADYVVGIDGLSFGPDGDLYACGRSGTRQDRKSTRLNSSHT